MTFKQIAVLVALAAVAVGAAGQDNSYPPVFEDAKALTYKQVDGVELKMWIFEPEGHVAAARRPAIVFFFGGGWRQGNPGQFAPHSRYLASRGMVAMVADYRVANRHGVKAVTCVEDAKSAVRWARLNAKTLGVDPKRLAAGGGSAGGHLAAATATVTGFDTAGENHSVSSVPNALVLFNPATVMAPFDGGDPFPADRMASLRERIGVDPALISPYHHVRKDMPPAIIFHGKADTTVPFGTAAAFSKKMKTLGNRAELVGYDGATHGFFNHGRDDGSAYHDTVRRMDEFLASLGWIKGKPTIQP